MAQYALLGGAVEEVRRSPNAFCTFKRATSSISSGYRTAPTTAPSGFQAAIARTSVLQQSLCSTLAESTG